MKTSGFRPTSRKPRSAICNPVKAELTFDAYSDTPIARVDSLFAASGAQFSLLPPDNATGNFTKVVQRIPETDLRRGQSAARQNPAGHVGHGQSEYQRRP
jgi:hypothetical protein